MRLIRPWNASPGTRCTSPTSPIPVRRLRSSWAMHDFRSFTGYPGNSTCWWSTSFSSDSIPLHLVMREALRVYFQRFTPHGLLAIHVSNRFLDLEPILGRLAKDAGVAALVCADAEDARLNRLGSTWVVMSGRPEDLAPLAADAAWKPTPGRRPARVDGRFLQRRGRLSAGSPLGIGCDLRPGGLPGKTRRSRIARRAPSCTNKDGSTRPSPGTKRH